MASNNFENIIVGGGHAGIEAALASARLGVQTLLLTQNIATIGEMSCNPSIGGIGKGHLVKEIDALGGIMALAADISGIQFRILNASKGPAVRATRAQTDRILYKKAIASFLKQQNNLTILEDTVDKLAIANNRVTGVITNSGVKFEAKTVVLAVGTFLNGRIHIGLENFPAGRINDPSSIALAKDLRSYSLRVARLKTGTPPRIDGNTLNYGVMQPQPGDYPTPIFSFRNNAEENNNAKNIHPRQVCCHITKTNEHTHEIIRANLDRSPLFTGIIEGTGPRYCPSIEDKIVRFADKKSHQIFVEPEGLTTTIIYPNGISTSLPFDVQNDLVHSIAGFENAKITRPGYAIEYDFFDPRDLKFSLESKFISGLFFAGQINGTTGYEEAAAQGLIAGLNAALQVLEKEPWYPERDQAYIGVMLEDLITCGTKEPYRMFTSRAEYRLLLREDNADLRLTEIGRKLGLINDAHWDIFNKKRDQIEQEKSRLHNLWIRPNTDLGKALTEVTGQAVDGEYRALELLRRPDITYGHLNKIEQLAGTKNAIQNVISEQIEIQVKYAGYINRQQNEIERNSSYTHTKIPDNLDYSLIHGLSTEVRQKLITVKPNTIGQAARIPGVTPAAISILLIYLKKCGLIARKNI